MNIVAFGEGPLELRVLVLVVVFALATALTLYTMSISRGLAEFLDAVADERLSWRQKLNSLWQIWRRRLS